MTIQPGSRIAHYEIVSLLGKGGMGEVWRAKDTKLGREVAIKILPEEFTKDAERLARFEREAKLLASLSHPNIAGIFEVGETAASDERRATSERQGSSFRAEGEESPSSRGSLAGARDDMSSDSPLAAHRSSLHYLVMQLAEGEDLAQRLKRGPLPIDDASAIAVQIALALDAAHEKGIVHRDLKPGNVMVDDDGNVKVLDFGLAKALETEEGDEDYSNSPTMIRAATHAGIIIGTAGYMSPEQARGKKVDKRADIWAFGVVLWEMLTGERLFAGETISDTLAAVLTKTPDLSELPDGTPSSLRWVLERCLERDPRKRLRDVGEARLAIERGDDRTTEVGVDVTAIQPARRSRRETVAWILCALLVVALVGVIWKTRRPATTSDAAPFTERLSPLDDADLRVDGGSSAVISHDGRSIVLVASNNGGTQLYLNRTDKLGTVPIPGTRDASAPFFSPDDQWIGFFADGKLKKIATSGGAAIVLCDAPVNRGGTWGESGKIVFTPGVGTGLSIVSENGGTPQQLTKPDEAKGERSHRWPEFLPGGEAVVYLAQTKGRNYEDGTIQVVSLKDQKTKIVTNGGAYPQWAASGHLLFARQGTLFAIPFDLDRLETSGTAVPVVQELLSSTGNEATCDGSAQFSVSSGGTLVYRKGVLGSNETRVAIIDRKGRAIAVSQPGNYMAPAIWTANGQYRVAVSISSGARYDVWTWDQDKQGMTRLTFDGISNGIPVWSPDGKQVEYTSTRDADGSRITGMFVRSSDGSGPERRLDSDPRGVLGSTGWVTSWGAENTLAYQTANSGDDITIFTLHLGPRGEARQSDSLFVGTNPDVSPDGRWIAYQYQQPGDETQVMVRSIDGGNQQYQVSRDGGRFPHWTKGGDEIVWNTAGQGFWAVSVAKRGEGLEIGAPEHILDYAFLAQDPLPTWDVGSEGILFAGLEEAESSAIDTKNVVLTTNFFDALRKLAPARR